MKKMIILVMLLFVVSVNANAQAPVVQNGGFESGWTSWSTDNGVWQIGTPTPGSPACYEGTQCAGTVLDGNYPPDTDSRLISYHMVLPTITGSEELHLQFRNWFSYSSSDSGQVQVAVWNGSSWGSWVNVGMPVAGDTSNWFLKDVDLNAYAGQTIRIAFYHTAAPFYESWGWYIDDIRIVVKTSQFTGDFETGWGDWIAENGIWQVGTPTGLTCYEGAQCAGTVLNGNYLPDADSRLISAPLVLPVVTGSEELHLQFRNWFSYSSSDSGQVQVAVWNGSSWGSWVNVGMAAAGDSGIWFLKDIDLKAYAGQTIRIAFYHTAAPFYESWGWYIDDIRIVVKTSQFIGDFETGQRDWIVENGVWQVGTPTGLTCYEGTQCAGTVLNSNYLPDADSRLISAPLVLPTVTGSEELHLQFRNWFSYSSSDSGQVQVAVWNGSSWGSWVNVGMAAAGDSGIWFLKDIDLKAYAGQTIRIAFYHTAAPFYESAGWYIDDIRTVVKTSQFTGDFETGWGDWIAENGIWQVGVPTAGPAACYEGEQCAGTILGGNYLPDADSRLISAPIDLPVGTGPEGVWLRFQTWFSYSSSDSGQVQLSEWNGSSWGSWVNIGTPVSSESGGWSLIHIDLTAYSGKKVRFAFYHMAAPFYESTGWYIDDLQVTGDDDSDGVGNWTDTCPGTPEGVSVDANGCSACQNNPTGVGCPGADDDGDGVINEIDECPNTPQGATVNAKGCSAQFQVQILDVNTTSCPTIQARLIVTDINGNVVSNLTEGNFEVYVSDTLQSPITVQYVDQTTSPVAAALALDFSGSMGAAAIADMKNAAVEFINQLASGDIGEIIKFANGVETVQTFTSNKTALIAAVNDPSAPNSSATEFYDAVYRAITDTSLQSDRKAVIAMTDGQDNHSDHSAADVISHAQSNGIPVFTIGLGKSVNTVVLRSIAEKTGGLYYESPDSSDLAAIYQAISTVLKNQYLITFNSSYRDGLSHPLRIVAADGNLFGSDEATFTVCKVSSSGVTLGDFNADGSTDVAAFHLSSDQFFASHAGNMGQYGWGADDCYPLIWDYNGNGATDVSIYHIPTNQWFVRGVPGDNLGAFGWGADEAVPLPGDYSGDGTVDRAFYHWPTNRWFVEGAGGSFTAYDFGWGGADSLPIAADYDGNGTTDMMLYHVPTNQWFVYGVGNLGQFGWNGSECIPVPGDWDGDGRTEIGIYHWPSNQWFWRNEDGTAHFLGQYGWGGTQSFPIPGDYNGDGVMERAFYRPAENWWFIEGESDVVWGYGGSEFMPITSQMAIYNWFRFGLGRFQ